MNAESYRLRDYRTADFDQLFALDEICFAAPFRFSRADMRRYVRSPKARILIAETDAGLGGFCMMHLQEFCGESAAYVTTVDVHPSHRRTGLARKMLQIMESRIALEGVASIFLHVFVENVAAMTLYDGLGYAILQTQADFYGQGLHACLYRKAISRF